VVKVLTQALLQSAVLAVAVLQTVQVEQQQEQQELLDKAALAVQVQVAELILVAVAVAEQQQLVEMEPQELLEQAAQDRLRIHLMALQLQQDKILAAHTGMQVAAVVVLVELTTLKHQAQAVTVEVVQVEILLAEEVLQLQEQ
jgi:hypothetical protein